MLRGLHLSRIPRHILDILIPHPLIGVSRLAQRGNNTALLRNIGMLRRKGGRRQPMHGSERLLDLVVQLVDLLQIEALDLVNHKIHKGDTQEAAAGPYEEDPGLQIRCAWAVIHEVEGA